MFKRVTCKDRVPLFDVDLHLTLKAEILEETVHCRNIIVVLGLGRFLRFGFDQDRALEPHLVLVIHGHLQHRARLLAFAAHVGV